MKYEDLSFEMINDEGMEVICDITAVIPDPENSNEPYVTYTDYLLDENDNFKNYYGKVVVENGQPVLKEIKDIETINKIIELSNDEVVKYVNDQIQENIS